MVNIVKGRPLETLVNSTMNNLMERLQLETFPNHKPINQIINQDTLVGIVNSAVKLIQNKHLKDIVTIRIIKDELSRTPYFVNMFAPSKAQITESVTDLLKSDLLKKIMLETLQQSQNQQMTEINKKLDFLIQRSDEHSAQILKLQEENKVIMEALLKSQPGCQATTSKPPDS